ncbi:(2Fe-2S)-binding protein [Xylella taiwanensis]|nr:(2Fe-2S)-binding protein [Xylella taiwanensis]NBI35959.1 (2Fe-2S)-binding protein [Xylella taiwanensis]QKD99047.1 (2Fe-2S)-binding protein [Xylella taiwanensis]
MPRVYICICNAVTDDHIYEVAASCANLTELTMRTACGSSCGSCLNAAAELLGKARAECVMPTVNRPALLDVGTMCPTR